MRGVDRNAAFLPRSDSVGAFLRIEADAVFQILIAHMDHRRLAAPARSENPLNQSLGAIAPARGDRDQAIGRRFIGERVPVGSFAQWSSRARPAEHMDCESAFRNGQQGGRVSCDGVFLGFRRMARGALLWCHHCRGKHSDRNEPKSQPRDN